MSQRLLGHATLMITNRYCQAVGCYDAVEAHKKYSPIDNLSTQSVGYVFLAFFILQLVETKVASPTRFVAANAMVAVLPQSNISSLSKRPSVPMKIKMKLASFRDSLIDVSPKSLLVVKLPLHA